MARIIENERQDVESTDQLEMFSEEEQVTPEPQEPPSIPEKYQNKSAEELVQMHQEAEKLLGRQSSEVGELRKVVDNYIQTQLTPEQQAPQEVEEIDFFTDPDKAVDRAIQNHPKIREAEAVTNQYRQSNAMAQLKGKHPDMEDILQDTKFAEWIEASKVRTRLFVEADQKFDHEAADELFSLWKERQNVVQQTAKVEQQARKQAVKAASTGNARGSSESAPKKVYRRADIINLMKTDPNRYAALQPEIMLAYQEGRVR
jgi:hypothetical protein|tara:strand:- start:424 stop:1200 length:777 start_codon:yes stop_codon:yes gene_type:complete